MSAGVVLEAGVGELSPVLRTRVEALRGRTDAIVQRALEAMGTAIPEYAQIADAAIARDVRQSVAHNVQLWFQSLLDGHPPGERELASLVAFGRRRVHQGVSLQGLLQAFRTGSRVLWDVLLEEAGDDAAMHRELLFKVSPYILLHFDLMGRTIGQAHSEEQQKRARWRDRLQHELCGVIFSHPDDAESFREHAQALGLDALASHIALAVRSTTSGREGLAPASDSDALAVKAARALGLDRQRLLGTSRHGLLLLWAPLAGSESSSAAERRCAEICAALLAQAPEIAAIGIGLPDSGARGWRRSAEQAMRALDLGPRLGLGRAPLRYSDLLLDDALQGTENVLRYLESFMERLTPEPQLIHTLQAFFEHRQHRKAVAGALNIHPNTLSYRLERIESILDLQLDDIGALTRLHTALRLRQLSQPLPTV